MIRAVLVMNTLGKPRLSKFYDYHPIEQQHEYIRRIYGVLCSRPENVSNFIEISAIFGADTRLVYKHFATLYFVFVFDSCENELAMLDLIQVFVESLDKCFKNVCELDIVFNFSKLHTILDEIIVGGQVLETSSSEIVKAVEEISKLEKSSNALSFVPKSALTSLCNPQGTMYSQCEKQPGGTHLVDKILALKDGDSKREFSNSIEVGATLSPIGILFLVAEIGKC